jgi:hypothetical protein
MTATEERSAEEDHDPCSRDGISFLHYIFSHLLEWVVQVGPRVAPRLCEW